DCCCCRDIQRRLVREWSCRPYTLLTRFCGGLVRKGGSIGFPALRLQEKFLFDEFGKSPPGGGGYQASSFSRYTGNDMVLGCSCNQPTVHILFPEEYAEILEFSNVRDRTNFGVDHGEKTGEACGAESFDSKS